MDDYIQHSVFGRKCVHLFDDKCLEDIQEVMDTKGTSKADYNFLFGIKCAILRRIDDNYGKNKPYWAE